MKSPRSYTKSSTHMPKWHKLKQQKFIWKNHEDLIHFWGKHQWKTTCFINGAVFDFFPICFFFFQTFSDKVPHKHYIRFNEQCDTSNELLVSLILCLNQLLSTHSFIGRNDTSARDLLTIKWNFPWQIHPHFSRYYINGNVRII